jgi:hypothetical protein
LILLRQRLGSSPAAWLLLSLCGIHTLVLWRLADVMGYVSDRHVLLLVFCGIYPTAAGSIAISNWLAAVVGGFWLRHRTGAAASARLVPRLAMIFLFAMTAFALPEVLKPMHTNRSGHRQAGLWLAEHANPADVVLDPYCWAHYYAGRVFLEGTAPAARSMQVNYVVVEHADHEHVRLVGLEKAVEFASFGRPVYHWPEKKSVENAKVVVYEVTQADIDRVNQRTQAQAVKRTKAR